VFSDLILIYLPQQTERHSAAGALHESYGSYTVKLNVLPPLANVKCHKILPTWKHSDSSFYKTVRCSLKHVQLAGFVDIACIPCRR